MATEPIDLTGEKSQISFSYKEEPSGTTTIQQSCGLTDTEVTSRRAADPETEEVQSQPEAQQRTPPTRLPSYNKPTHITRRTPSPTPMQPPSASRQRESSRRGKSNSLKERADSPQQLKKQSGGSCSSRPYRMHSVLPRGFSLAGWSDSQKVQLDRLLQQHQRDLRQKDRQMEELEAHLIGKLERLEAEQRADAITRRHEEELEAAVQREVEARIRMAQMAQMEMATGAGWGHLGPYGLPPSGLEMLRSGRTTGRSPFL